MIVSIRVSTPLPKQIQVGSAVDIGDHPCVVGWISEDRLVVEVDPRDGWAPRFAQFNTWEIEEA